MLSRTIAKNPSKLFQHRLFFRSHGSMPDSSNVMTDAIRREVSTQLQTYCDKEISLLSDKISLLSKSTNDMIETLKDSTTVKIDTLKETINTSLGALKDITNTSMGALKETTLAEIKKVEVSIDGVKGSIASEVSRSISQSAGWLAVLIALVGVIPQVPAAFKGCLEAWKAIMN
eukprot:TRINITY_DN563_c0_g1_i2.p1 TRINITY_DN563_c0_g1~~TRINITY_DN563_c0_g1_i2.p1  ORF type:complete len:189 (+),score=32.11 TRINITY_DN563_c0_g1_i2:48-569(+)